MKEQSIAKAYAKAIIELGDSQKVDVAGDLLRTTEVINQSNDFENLLFLDVFTAEEKQAVLDEVLRRLKVTPLVSHFFNYLIQEKRIHLFPLIFKEVIVFDDDRKGFLKGVVEGVEDSLNDRDKKALVDFLTDKMGKKVQLEYRENNSLTAGLKVTVEDLQLDATIDHQFDRLKHEILGE